MVQRLRVLLGGLNLLDKNGQYSTTHNAEFTKTPFSVWYQSMPLGLLYLAAAQRAWGKTTCEYEFFDFQLPATEEFTLEKVFAVYARYLEDFRPDVVALGCLTHRQKLYLERAVRVAREYGREHNPDLRIIVGGQAATGEPGRFLQAGADAVGMGEGELTFTAFIDCVAAGDDGFEQIAGLALPGAGEAGMQGLANRKGLSSTENVHLTKPRPLITNLDDIPMPAWDLADVKGYIKRNKGVYSPMLTQRGCPYACVYCCHDRKFRAHSPKRVVDEMQFLSENYGATRLDIIDEIFNCRRERVLQIRDEKQKRGLNKVSLQDFDGLRADIMDEEIVDALKDMGFVAFSVAIESANPRVQKLIQKHLRIDRTLESIRLSVDRDMFVNAFFMIGFPSEQPEEVSETLQLARECHSHQSTISKVEAHPGTPMWDWAVESGLNLQGFESSFTERYGEREDPGFLDFPEEDLHAMWLRGVFDVYNDSSRMRRLSNLLSPFFFRQMYKKFYQDHGIWSDDFAPEFERLTSGQDPRFDDLSKAADKRFALPPLSAIKPARPISG